MDPSFNPTPPVASPSQQLPEAKHEIKFPLYVVILGAVTLIAFVFGLIRLPHSISRGIDFAQGKKALAQSSPKLAIQKLKPIVDEYKDAEDVRVELFRAYVMAGDGEGANAQYNYFEGRKVSREINEKLDEITNLANAKFKDGEK